MRMTCHSADTDTTDCGCGRASKRPALTHRLYHKWDSGALSCLAGFGGFVGVGRDLNLMTKIAEKNVM